MTERRINVGDENLIADLIIQNMNLTVSNAILDEESIRRIVTDALLKSLPEVIAQPLVIEHLRTVTAKALTEAVANTEDIEEVARQVWHQAEPEIAAFIETLAFESQSTVSRLIFERLTGDYETEEFSVNGNSEHVWRTTLNKGIILEIANSEVWREALTLLIVGPNRSWEVPVNLITQSRIETGESGVYDFHVMNAGYAGALLKLRYRISSPNLFPGIP